MPGLSIIMAFDIEGIQDALERNNNEKGKIVAGGSDHLTTVKKSVPL